MRVVCFQPFLWFACKILSTLACHGVQHTMEATNKVAVTRCIRLQVQPLEHGTQNALMSICHPHILSHSLLSQDQERQRKSSVYLCHKIESIFNAENSMGCCKKA